MTHRIRTVATTAMICCWSVAWSNQCSGFDPPSRAILRPAIRDQDQYPPVVTALVFHPGGRLLVAAGDDHVVRVWDTDTREVLAANRLHDDWVHGVCLPGGDEHIASVAADGRLLEWNWRTNQHRVLLNTSQPLWAVAATPDGGRLIAAGFDSPIYIVDRRLGIMESSVPCGCREIRALAVSPDGSLVAAGGSDGKLRIISTSSGKLLREMTAHGRAIRAVGFDASGTRVISGGDDRALCVWDVGDGRELMHLQSGTAKTRALCVLDHDRIATAGTDNVIRIWDLKLQTEITRLEGHGGSIAALAAHEAKLASGGFDAAVRLWDVPQKTHWQTAQQQEATER